MKLSVSFDSLWHNVQQMGAKNITLDIGDVWKPELDPLDAELAKGREVNIHELEADNGVLSFKGRQVVLYIPDHGIRAQKALDDGGTGNKFHIAQCCTLNEMKQKKRLDRYFAKNNLSEQFHIHGSNEYETAVEGHTSLNVCKHCLNYLNYKGSAYMKSAGRNRVVGDFDMGEFFSTYSSVFRHMPKEMGASYTKGYTDDWADVSSKAKKAVNNTCSECSVTLNEYRHLLHTHHINGVKHDNSRQNLKVLCIDCHRKQPMHDHMFVKHADMQTINHLRREQGLIKEQAPDWSTVLNLADPAFFGVLAHARNKGCGPPEVGYELTDDRGKVIEELELAWPSTKFGIAIDKPENIDGWYLLGLKDAMDYFSNLQPRR